MCRGYKFAIIVYSFQHRQAQARFEWPMGEAQGEALRVALAHHLPPTESCRYTKPKKICPGPTTHATFSRRNDPMAQILR
jgi:hypothetical protein